MALSVKRFVHPVDCPQPENYVNVNYHATSADELCAGNGSLYQIWGDYSSLANIFANQDSSTGSNTDLCNNGMDVVFLVDYTASMGGEIDDVKTGISNIVSTINTESGGDYRLGLVVFDEYYSGQALDYQNVSAYTSLPAAQKIDTTQNSRRTAITCLEKMSTVGNSTAFETQLNLLNTASFPLGDGAGSPEPSGIAGNYVVNGFAGNWRSDAIKMVILITDNSAGGLDDTANATDDSFFTNTLIPNATNAGVQFLIQTNYTLEPNYTNLAEDTIPQGLIDTSVNFSDSNWPSNTLIPYIEQLCDETFTYNCDPAPAGWYQEVGQNTVYYWDGTSWTQSEVCEYTVTVSIVDNISNGTVDQIPSNHVNYGGNASTFSYTGSIGTSISQIWDCDPNTYYNNLTLSGANISLVSGTGNLVTATNNGTGADGSDNTLTSEEFKFSGTIQGDASYTLTISGSAQQINYRHTVYVRSNVYDTDGTSPGYMDFAAEEAGWTLGSYYNGTHNQNLAQYYKSFDAPYNSSQSWGDVSFLPLPSGYDLVLDSTYGTTYSDAGTASHISNTSVITYNATGETMSGTFTMPAVTSGYVIYSISGQSNQAQYTTQLNVTESITGAYFDSAYNTVSYTGYEGQSTTISIPFLLDTDYNDVDINVASQVIVTDLAANALVSNVAFDTLTNTLTFDLEIGGSNVSGDMAISGSATEKRYQYQVDFDTSDLDSNVSIPTYTWNSEAGVDGGQQTVSLTGMLADYTYNITGSTHVESPSGGVFDVISASGHDVVIDLPSMPSGGGSATVTVLGTATEDSYDFAMTYTTDNTDTNWNSGGGINLPSTTITYSGTAGSTINAARTLYAEDDKEFANAGSVTVSGENSSAVSNTSSTVASSGSYDDRLNVGATLTMPSGGGAASIDVSINKMDNIVYTYTMNFATSQGATGITSIYQNVTNVVTTNNGDGTFTCVFSGTAGQTISGPSFAVNANNTVDYDAEITGFGYSTGANVLTPTEVSPWSNNDDAFNTSLVMPSGGGSGTVTVNTTNSKITHSFILTTSSNITGVTIGGEDDVVTYTGGVGDRITIGTINPVLSSGYSSYDITSVSNQGSYVTANISGSPEVVTGEITMPSGGGSRTIYLNGSATLTPTTIAQRTLTVNYNESITGAFIATEGNTSSGGGAGISQQSFTGPVGSQGVEYNAIRVDSGYQDPVVSSVDTSSSSYISSGTGSGSDLYSSTLYADWKFSYTIPPTNQTVNLTVNGSVTDSCAACDINASATPPTNYNGNDGTIDVIVIDACIPSYSWTLNGVSTTPAQNGPLAFQFRGLSAGLYTVVLTAGNGCTASASVIIANPSTTQATTSFYYYSAFGCDTDTTYTLRSTSQFPITAVQTNKIGEDSSMCLFREVQGPTFDYSITGFGDCNTCITEEDPGGGGGPR